jgi:hypothetical protein
MPRIGSAWRVKRCTWENRERLDLSLNLPQPGDIVIVREQHRDWRRVLVEIFGPSRVGETLVMNVESLGAELTPLELLALQAKEG